MTRAKAQSFKNQKTNAIKSKSKSLSSFASLRLCAFARGRNNAANFLKTGA
jgi:hypothetical protein